MKLNKIISEMFKNTALHAPASALDNIMAAARAKTAKKNFAIKLWQAAFSVRGAFAAGALAVVAAVGLVNFNQAPAEEELMAMYADFNYQMDFFEDDAQELLFDLHNI